MPKPTGGPPQMLGYVDPEQGQYSQPSAYKARQKERLAQRAAQRGRSGTDVQSGGLLPLEDIGASLAGHNRAQIRSDTGTQYDPSYSDPVKARQYGTGDEQSQFSQELRRRAMGQGPSVAQGQLQAGQDEARRAAMSQAASARGTSGAQQARMSSIGQAEATRGASREAAMLRAQEMQTAGQTFGDALTQRRAQELQAQGMAQDEAVTVANLEEQRKRRDLDAQIAGANIADRNAARSQQFSGGLMEGIGSAVGMMAMSDVQAKDDVRPFGSSLRERLGGQASDGGAATTQRANVSETPRTERVELDEVPTREAESPDPVVEKDDGGIAGMLGGILSDEGSKEEIQTLRSALRSALGGSDDATRESLDPVKPISFRYKPEVAARIGETTDDHAGVSAQDLEKSPAYSGAVRRDPESGMLALDNNRLTTTNTAMLGGLNERMKALEDGGEPKRRLSDEDRARLRKALGV